MKEEKEKALQDLKETGCANEITRTKNSKNRVSNKVKQSKKQKVAEKEIKETEEKSES